MKNKIFFFLLIFFLQVFIFNKIYFFNALILSPIILIFLLLNHYKNSFFLLTLAFFIGFLIDVFNDSHGTFSFGLTILVFIRNYWLEVYFPIDKIPVNSFFSSYQIGLKSFFYYSFPLIIIFQSFIYLIEINSLANFPNYLIKILLSSFLTFVLVLILQLLLFSSNSRYE